MLFMVYAAFKVARKKQNEHNTAFTLTKKKLQAHQTWQRYIRKKHSTPRNVTYPCNTFRCETRIYVAGVGVDDVGAGIIHC